MCIRALPWIWLCFLVWRHPVAAEPGQAEPGAAELGQNVPQQPPGRFSAGVFLGGGLLSDEIELGNAFFADQVPGSGFLFGLRGAYIILPDLTVEGQVRVRLSVEVEGNLLLSSTGRAEMRPSRFAPVFAWRVHSVLDVAWQGALTPFALVGIGGQTVISDSLYMWSPDTDAAIHFGVGSRYHLAGRYGLRADLRLGITAGRYQAVSSIVEAHFGFFYRLARH